MKINTRNKKNIHTSIIIGYIKPFLGFQNSKIPCVPEAFALSTLFIYLFIFFARKQISLSVPSPPSSPLPPYSAKQLSVFFSTVPRRIIDEKNNAILVYLYETEDCTVFFFSSGCFFLIGAFFFVLFCLLYFLKKSSFKKSFLKNPKRDVKAP